MRTLAFRVFHKGEQKMCRVISTDFNEFIIVRFPEFEGEDDSYNDQMLLNEFEPLQQYTGMNDKHGVPIYEGDRVMFSNWKPKEVIYEGGLGFMGFRLKDTDLFLMGYEQDNYEVVGHIYHQKTNV